MHKAFKYIVLSTTIALAGISAEAKTTPGIPPVYTPGAPGNEEVWHGAEHGVALRELENRSPEKMLRSLVQTDGIIDFRPNMLTGLTGSHNSASFISKLPKSKIPGGSNLCGFIAYNESDYEIGLYRLPLTAAQEAVLLRSAKSFLSSFRGGAASDRYYVMSYFGTTIQNGQDQCLTAIFDKNDWSLLSEVGDYGQYERVSSDMTYDPVTERFYGCFLDRKQTRWLLGYMQLDSSNPNSTISSVKQLCTLETSLNGLAADANGVLWAIRNDNGDLVTINKKTGEMTKVASTGFVPEYNGSLTWDNTNGILYWAVTYSDATAPSGISSALLTVDSTTGALQHVYDYAHPTQVCGLYTEFTAAAAAPGAFTDFAVNFTEESLSGTVTFNAPTALTDGTGATGELSYTLSVVKENGYVAYRKDHTCQYGDTNISIPLEFKTAGNYTFTVQGFNDAGKSYPVSIKRYVGSDIPESAGNVNMTYADGVVSVTWDEVNQTSNGGYFDPTTVSYDVTLTQVDADGNVSELPSKNVTATSAQWEVEATDNLRGFKTSVTTVFGSNSGEATATPFIWFGGLNAPFKQTMQSAIDGWSTINVGTGSDWIKENSMDGKGWAIAYNWGTKNDAWLFSPKIKLEKDRYYTMSFRTYSTVVTQSLHVWIGKEASIEGMEVSLADCSVPGSTKPSTANLVTFGFACPETGYYNLGFHNDTRSDTWTNKPYMWINDVTCAVAPDNAPAPPEMEVDYNTAGAISAKITLTAPTKTYGGLDIDKLDAVTLNINGKVAKQWDNVEPGTVLKYDYTGTKKGTYCFIADATYQGVSGVPNIQNYHLGISLPVDPEWVESIEQPDNLGTVDVTWAPVDKGTNGQNIGEYAISYNVMDILSNSYIKRNVTEQPFVFKACDSDDQTAMHVSVNAETAAGVSSTYGTYSKQSIMHVGKPYDLPVRETFEKGLAHYSWSFVNQHSVNDYVKVANTLSENGDKDANGDGYCLKAFVPYGGSQASLYSGAINIPADAHNPVIGFAIYRKNYGDNSDNDNTIVVSILGDKTQGSLKPVRAGDQGFGWQYYYYDMSIFKGQKVKILITFQTNSYTSHYMDDIRFFDAPSKDLCITTFSSPAETEPNQRLRMSVNVTNMGTSTLKENEAYVEVRRLNDDVVVNTRNLPSLSAFQSAGVTFNDKLNNSYDSEVKYKATVVYNGDKNPENNTAETTVILNHSTLPAPSSLTGDRNDEGFASLEWKEPDLTANYPKYEIGFETSLEASTTELEGFTTLDIDGNPVDEELGISGPRGFTTFPHSTLAHSGDWMLVSPCNAEGLAKEDWLISPKLSGKAQTISFYARTNWNAYETFSVLTSTTGDAQADFTTKVLEKTTDSNDWKRFDIEVPEGTLYFAIVCKAEDTSNLIYLMLDDFTFEGADSNEGLSVEGYNAYRDNEMVEEIDPLTKWEDLLGTPGGHFYRVTARYGDRGESSPSNEVFLFTRGSGVDGITDAIGKVYAEQGRIVIEGAEGCNVKIVDMKGIVMFATAKASDNESVELVSGVYVVTIDGASVKVQVR